MFLEAMERRTSPFGQTNTPGEDYDPRMEYLHASFGGVFPEGLRARTSRLVAWLRKKSKNAEK